MHDSMEISSNDRVGRADSAILCADAVACSIGMFVGTMTLEERRRVESFVLDVLADRERWARHAGERWWHFIIERAGGIVVTRCRGRWAETDAYETEARPPKRDRCTACDPSAIARGLRELRDATALADGADPR